MERVLCIFHFSENIYCDKVTLVVQTIQARFTLCLSV